MDRQEVIAKTEAFVKESLDGQGAGHDWWHIQRVEDNATRIAEVEGADLYIVRLAALLHDIADYKFHAGDEDAGPRIARSWLQSLGLPEGVIEQVCRIIHEVSFRGAGTPVERPSSLEGQVVQDADRLDAIGAIGIARAFSYGGYKGRSLYEPDISPEQHSSFDEYKRNQSPTINHFYEKLLLLRDLMNTETARRIADGRHAYIQEFLERFFAEWQGRD